MVEKSALSKSDSKMWSMLSNLLGGLAAFFVSPLGWLPPLVIFLIFRERSAFVRKQSAESLNFQLTNLIVVIAGVAVIVVGGVFTLGIGLVIFIPVGVVAALVWLVLFIVWVILASVRASKGVAYRYPINIRMVK
jgi:uncharacterized Tic20 family protein